MPFSTETLHSFLSESGAKVEIRLLTLVMMASKRFIISGPSIWSSLMSRSTLLMNRTGRTFSFRACLTTVSVWGMVPSTAHARMMHPSTALMALVTSPPKSTWPGVSMRLTR